jgi:hypothetical protein
LVQHERPALLSASIRKAAIAFHAAYYNLVKIHGTLRCTPALAAGAGA